jgi:hypothetical protein
MYLEIIETYCAEYSVNIQLEYSPEGGAWRRGRNTHPAEPVA